MTTPRRWAAESRRQATLEGCDLESANFDYCDTNVSDAMGGDLMIFITESGKSFPFKIDDSLFINGPWYIGDN
jgi:hypothetical protein